MVMEVPAKEVAEATLDAPVLAGIPMLKSRTTAAEAGITITSAAIKAAKTGKNHMQVYFLVRMRHVETEPTTPQGR
jgi:hypothetical protein